MSEGIVETLVASILAKLELGSRTQVAAYVPARRRLAPSNGRMVSTRSTYASSAISLS